MGVASFVSFVFFVSCVTHAFASVHCCFVVTWWVRADLLGLVGDVYCIFCTFLMWYPGSGVVLSCIVTLISALFLTFSISLSFSSIVSLC